MQIDVQAHNPVPEDAWEYQIRKSLNDAAYNGLQYVPYCSTMPVQEKCDNPKFMWVSSTQETGTFLSAGLESYASLSVMCFYCCIVALRLSIFELMKVDAA